MTSARDWDGWPVWNDAAALEYAVRHYGSVRRSPVSVKNLTIEPLRPDTLHANWPFLKRGAVDIWKRVKAHSNWTTNDLYAALRYPEASHTVGWIVTRNLKALGWCCGEIQRDRYGGLEFFLWCAWTIPPRERAPEDDVPGAREQMVEFVRGFAKNNGCERVTTLSARQLESLGWIKGHTVYYLPA